MEWYMVLALIGTGFLAGFINVNAGGGSMLSVPLLMFMGLPANVANGTNRIAILLAGLVLGCGNDLVKANALKVFIVLLYMVFSIGIFIYNKQVDIWAGLILAAGNMLGGWVGVNVMVKEGAKYVRYMLIVAMVVVILNLFGVF